MNCNIINELFSFINNLRGYKIYVIFIKIKIDIDLNIICILKSSNNVIFEN